MSRIDLGKEIEFGLENLETIRTRISYFEQQAIEEAVKVSALSYECLGYYNALEHLMIRIIKYLKIEVPTGAFSHRDTLKVFEGLVDSRGIGKDSQVITVVESLMAFRHVATKIYGFLIDWKKPAGNCTRYRELS